MNKLWLTIALILISTPPAYARGGGGHGGSHSYAKSYSMGSGSRTGSASKSPRYTGGPVVKTGPTRGNVRSRNQDGSWRKKRSDAEE